MTTDLQDGTSPEFDERAEGEALLVRLRQLVAAQGLSNRAFAAAVGVSGPRMQTYIGGKVERPSVPPATVVASVLRAFPEVSARWLLLGEGDMTAGTGVLDASAERRRVTAALAPLGVSFDRFELRPEGDGGIAFEAKGTWRPLGKG